MSALLSLNTRMGQSGRFDKLLRGCAWHFESARRAHSSIVVFQKAFLTLRFASQLRHEGIILCLQSIRRAL